MKGEIKLLIAIIMLCLFVTGCIEFEYINQSNDQKEVQKNTSAEVTFEEQLIKYIENNLSFKYDHVTLNKINDNMYDAFIKLRRPDDAYDNVMWMASDGMSTINSIKNYRYDEVDKYISMYNIYYYNYWDILGETVYKNDHSKRKIESVAIKVNGKNQIIASKQIDKFHEERLKEEKRIVERSKYDIEVDAKTISKVYYNNKLNGNKNYFGKRIKTYGKFTSVEKGVITGWNVILVTGERYDYYCSTFAEGEEKHFSEYNRGEKLIIYAKVDELIGGYLNLKDCDLEKQK